MTETLYGPKTPTKTIDVYVLCGETFDQCNKRNRNANGFQPNFG